MDENKNSPESAQNIDGVLEELKKSYSSSNSTEKFDMSEETSAVDVSKDELQEKLRNQFLDEKLHSVDNLPEDDYAIDEDFLNYAYTEDAFDEQEIAKEALEASNEEKNEECSENIEENDYEFYEGFGESDKKIESEEALEEEMEALQEASDNEGPQEIQKEETDEDYQENQEIPLYEGLEKIQEEANSEAVEEIYASQKIQEIQEEAEEDIQIDEDEERFLDDFLVYDEEIDWEREAVGASAVAVAIDEDEFAKDEIDDADEADEYANEPSPQKLADDNYVDVFYRSNDEGPFGNRSFKEIIADTTESVESLEAALNSGEDYDYETESFDEVEGVPLVIEDEDTYDANRELDSADLALLLEFGYKDDLLKTVSSEDMEKLSSEEFENSVEEEISAEELEVKGIEKEEKTEIKPESKPHDSAEFRKIKTKEKIKNQYLSYRKMRGAALFKLLISSALTLILMLYELLPIFGVDFPRFMNREKNLALYVFFGLVLLLAVAIPASKRALDSFKAFLADGINAYIIAGVTATITLLYDFIIIFAVPDMTVAPTFHLCVAILIVLAELSELLQYTAEVRNYEYYFSEFVFDDYEEDDISNYKYTLQKSEGRSSIAEKLYAGGVSPKCVICAPQHLDSISGFFDANKTKARKSRITFSLIIISAILGFVFTIISAIVSETFWIAVVAFMATLGFTTPIIAIVAEWLPYERLSANNYNYGAAFASEASIEKTAECDMFVFYDLHLFERCEAKNVNLAIYDSTTKETLLSCLNSVYCEIGGPLQAAIAATKPQSYGEANVVRIARNGVEATVSSYSVLIGDEQFMSHYGIAFPTASLENEDDKIFTLCVSLNGRPTARLAVKYKLNDVFLNLVQQIAEDQISCVVETYDPMINTALVSRLRKQIGFPINIVHKNVTDLAVEKYRKNKDAALFSATGKEIPVLARGSRLNLAVAASNAKKIKRLRFILNIATCAAAFLGLLVTLALVLTDALKELQNLELFVILYWLLSIGILVGFMIWRFPKRDRFAFKNEKDRN